MTDEKRIVRIIFVVTCRQVVDWSGKTPQELLTSISHQEVFNSWKNDIQIKFMVTCRQVVDWIRKTAILTFAVRLISNFLSLFYMFCVTSCLRVAAHLISHFNPSNM